MIKKFLKVTGAAVALCFMLSMGACATYSTVSGVRTPLGALSSAKINADRESKVVAEYSVILGLVTAGYDKFLEKTKGKDIDIIDTNFFGIFQKVKAVTR